MEVPALIFLPILFLIAASYASVGHGGASGYLALMALLNVEANEMRFSALVLNVFVSGIAFYYYYKAGYFRFSLFIPFAVSSIPFAFIGASITLDPKIYKIILGICLIFAVIRILAAGRLPKTEKKPISIILAIFIGALLGFVSGMIGIGGGIILSPVLLLLHWANVKETAATSALFILVNSCAGIFGVSLHGEMISPEIVSWVLVAICGGGFGAYFGSVHVRMPALTNLLAGVLLMASVKLLFV